MSDVVGEHGEFLGILFEDGEIDKSQQEGGPITDSITLSSEKMLEMTADKDVLFHFTTTGPMRDGHLRFRTMTLGFAPAAIGPAPSCSGCCKPVRTDWPRCSRPFVLTNRCRKAMG